MKDFLINNVWVLEVFYDDEKEQFIVVWFFVIFVERYMVVDSLGVNKSYCVYYIMIKDF